MDPSFWGLITVKVEGAGEISPDLNILVIGQYCFPLVELDYFIEEQG